MINDNLTLMAIHDGRRMAFNQILDIMDMINTDRTMAHPDWEKLRDYITREVNEEWRICNAAIIKAC